MRFGNSADLGDISTRCRLRAQITSIGAGWVASTVAEQPPPLPSPQQQQVTRRVLEEHRTQTYACQRCATNLSFLHTPVQKSRVFCTRVGGTLGFSHPRVGISYSGQSPPGRLLLTGDLSGARVVPQEGGVACHGIPPISSLAPTLRLGGMRIPRDLLARPAGGTAIRARDATRRLLRIGDGHAGKGSS